jgi:monoamine oxidase
MLTRIELWPWGDLDSVSALLILRDAIHFKDGSTTSVIRGGSERLPQAFAKRLGDRISYDTVVERIEQDAKGVRVGIRRHGTLSTIEGARAICTLPFSLLSRVAFSPVLGPDKRRAIDELPYVSITRVYLETRERFWEREGSSGFIDTDLPLTHLEPMTMNQGGTHGIIAAHVPGAQARRLMALAPEARVRDVRDQVARMFPKDADQVLGGTSKCWDEDPWARGAYAYFKPGQMTSLMPHLATPEGRIHFAGEHISAFQGWMQGALESGQRAAAEIVALSR